MESSAAAPSCGQTGALYYLLCITDILAQWAISTPLHSRTVGKAAFLSSHFCIFFSLSRHTNMLFPLCIISPTILKCSCLLSCWVKHREIILGSAGVSQVNHDHAMFKSCVGQKEHEVGFLICVTKKLFS